MYLDMSEQARLIYSVGETHMSELFGLCRPSKIFRAPGCTLSAEVEWFLALNGKFTFHPKKPLDDQTLTEQWSNVESTVMWGFWFRNQKTNRNFVQQIHVRSEAVIPEGIPLQIQEGLDDGLRELLSQAASARQLWSDRLNPKVTPVKDYLKANNLMVKPTDKNLGLAAFPASLYFFEIVKHIKEGPYEEAVYPPALDFHSDILKRLPKTGLTKADIRFITQHRDILWPRFHMIPKVNKSPWA